MPCLFKLKHALNVKRLVQLYLRRSHWEDAGDGWQCMENGFELKGWSQRRRVILLREAPAAAPVGAGKRRRRDRYGPPLAEGEGWDAQSHPRSGRIAVPVTSEEARGGFGAAALVRHYRERADAGNIIGEAKNPWG